MRAVLNFLSKLIQMAEQSAKPQIHGKWIQKFLAHLAVDRGGVGLYAAELQAGVGGIFALAFWKKGNLRRLGKTCSAMTSELLAISWTPQPRSRGNPASVFPRCGRFTNFSSGRHRLKFRR